MCFVLEMVVPPDGNLHSSIASEITRLITTGIVTPGYPLPSTRLLSEHLRVSRNTVIRAYQNLEAEGIVESRPPKGTFVSERLPAALVTPALAAPPRPEPSPHQPATHATASQLSPAPPRIRYDFSFLRPAREASPTSAWQRIAFQTLRAAPRQLARAEHPAGAPALRRAIADYLGPSRGICVSPEQIVVTSGLRQSLAVALDVVAGRGQRVAVESVRLAALDRLLERYGCIVEPVDVDGFGLIPERLENRAAEVVCVSAARHFPYGGTMPAERRQALLAWCARHGAYVLEFEVQNDYRYEGLLPATLTANAALERTLLAGAFDSAMGAGVRIGYLVVPQALAARAAQANEELGNACGWLEQNVMTTFIESDAYKHHLLRLRKLMMARRDILLSVLRLRFGRLDIEDGNSGTYLQWRLPAALGRYADLEPALRAAGIAVSGMGDAAIACSRPMPGNDRMSLLGYGGMSVEDLRRGATALCDVLEAHANARRQPEFAD